MAVIKSASITSWDSTPIVDVTTGEGAPGFMKTVGDSLVPLTGGSIGDTYRFCRIPTNAKIKRVLLTIQTASTAGAADIDVAFSDSTVDGTVQSLAGGVVQLSGPVDNKLFGAAQSFTSTAKNSDITFNNTFTTLHQNLPLWQVLVNLLATQFTADPGGYFDIIAKVTTLLTVTFGNTGIEVDYVEGP